MDTGTIPMLHCITSRTTMTRLWTYVIVSVVVSVFLSLTKVVNSWDEYTAEVVHVQQVSSKMTSCCRDAGLNPQCRVSIHGQDVNVYHAVKYQSTVFAILSLTSCVNDFLICAVLIWTLTGFFGWGMFWVITVIESWVRQKVSYFMHGESTETNKPEVRSNNHTVTQANPDDHNHAVHQTANVPRFGMYNQYVTQQPVQRPTQQNTGPITRSRAA